MGNEIVLFKYVPYIVLSFAYLLSIIAGVLLYSGLSSKEEKMQTRIRFKNSVNKNFEKVVQDSLQSKAEIWLRKANYPLGLNGFRYLLIIGGFIAFLTIYYVILPMIINGRPDKLTIVSTVIIGLVAFIAAPNNPFSLFVYIMKRIIEYHHAKKHAEVFMLYDLLINEVEMMTVSRLNTYSILRNIKPYFTVLDKSFTMLLSSWGSDEGPIIALDRFSQELSSKEADALIGVLKNLDNLDRNTALGHLRGMHNMFVRSQIENYRRKRKITTDILKIPIKATHFIIILNFLVLIVTMVSAILQKSRL